MHTAIFGKRASWALAISATLGLGSIGCEALDGLTPTVATPTLIELDVQNGNVVSLPGPDALSKEYHYVNMIGATDTNLAFCNLTAEGTFCNRWNNDTRAWTPAANPGFLGDASTIAVNGLLCALATSEVGSCYDPDADAWTVHDEYMSLIGHTFVGVWAGKPIVNKIGELFAVDLAAKTIESLGSAPQANCGDRALFGEIGSDLYAVHCFNAYRYSPNDKNWVLLATGTNRLSGLMPLVVGDKLCEVDPFERLVGCFEPATNTFTFSKPAPVPAGWIAYGTGDEHNSVTVGGRIYASFTYSNPEPTLDDTRQFQGSVQEYNLETDTWTEKVRIPDGSAPEMTTLGGRVYAIGNLNAPIVE